MRKQIATFTILFLISSALSAQVEQIGNYSSKEEIKEAKIEGKGVFLASKHSIRRISPKKNWTKTKQSVISPHIDTSSNYVLTGTKVSSSDLLLYTRDGELEERVPLANWIDNVRLYEQNGDILMAGASEDFLSIHYLDGSLFSRVEGGRHSRGPGEALDLDSDGEKELLVKGSHRAGNPYYGTIDFELMELDGDIEWQTKHRDSFTSGKITPKNNILVRWDRGFSLRYPNGSEKWKISTNSVPSRPVFLEDNFIYSNSSYLIQRSSENGRLTTSNELDSRLSLLKLHPEQNILIGRQGKNLSIFSLEGEKLYTSKFENGIQDIQLTQFVEGGSKEVAVVSRNKIFFYRIRKEDSQDLNHSVSETVFVGKGKEMLKAVALNQTSFITDSYSKVEEAVEETGLKAVSVNVDGPNQTENINQAFNLSKPRYYVENKEKAVYVAALAAKNNASITFNENKADRDFSNYSVKGLQEKFIDEFKPNHVTVADLSSDKGVLAAYMAVQQGSLPVNFDQEYSYPEESVNAIKWDQDNGVISLDRKINNKFEQIGENQNTIFDGKYVSLLSGPRKMHNDPVEPGLISDPEDGSNYYSDLSYGNLDSDRMLEAGVGRYPREVSKASLVFHRSMNREIGEDALVASEYLHSNWPVILATFGGGMRHGKITNQILNKEGFNTTHMVERRSQPVALLFDLMGVPTQMDLFVKSVDTTQDEVGDLLTQGSARAIKNAAYMIRGLQYGEKAMEMYFEFRWSDWDPGTQELDIPEQVSREEFGDLVLSFLPESKTRLNEQNLVNQMKTADIIHYQGVGNDEGWILPNNDSSTFVSDRYNGTNKLEPEELPELEKPIVFDSSNLAGNRNAKMKSAFLDKGASAFIGFSGVNYAAFSSHIDQVFFRRGKTLGNSLKKSVNSLRQGAAVFHPASAHVSGVGEKMSRSASLYGNPEMPKDPITPKGWNITRECKDFECTVNMQKSPDYRVEQKEGKKLIMFNTTEYLLVPGTPITPLYSADYRLPQNSSILDTSLETEYKELENAYLPETELLSHSGSYTNISERFDTFPENLSNTSVTENELRHVQAGLQKTPNTTRVLENIQLEFSYRTPISMEIEKQNGLATASVNSKTDFDANLIYSLDSNKTTRNVEIEKGHNRFELGKLEKGTTKVEAYLVNQQIVEQAKTELTLKSDPEIQVFAPDIHRGDVRKIRAVVENTNSFPVTEKLRIETSDKIQLGMLEKPVRKVRLEPNETRQVSWRFTGIRKGNISIKLRNSSSNLTVESGRSTDRFLSTGQFYRKLGSPYRSFSQTQTDSKLVLELKTEKGRIIYVEKPGYEYSKIETDSFSALSNISAGRKMQKVSAPDGFFLRKISNGVVKTRSEGLSQKRAEELLGKLDRETGKLKKFHKSEKDKHH